MSQTITRIQNGGALAGGIEEPIIPQTFVGDTFGNAVLWLLNGDPVNAIAVVTIYTLADDGAGEEANATIVNLAPGAAVAVPINALSKWARATATPVLAIAGFEARIQIRDLGI